MQGLITKNIQLKFSTTSGLFWIESSSPKTLSYVVLVNGSTENLSIIYQWPFFTFCCSPNQTRTHLFETRKLMSRSKIYKAINHFEKKNWFLMFWILRRKSRTEIYCLIKSQLEISPVVRRFFGESRKKRFSEKGQNFWNFVENVES